MAFRPAGTTTGGKTYQAFWTCPQTKAKHPDQKSTIDDTKWREQLAQQQAAPSSPDRIPGEDG